MGKTLAQGELNTEYTVVGVDTLGDEEMKNFLLSLGCYEGQTVTIVSKLHENFVIVIKGGRYSVDATLARAILI